MAPSASAASLRHTSGTSRLLPLESVSKELGLMIDVYKRQSLRYQARTSPITTLTSTSSTCPTVVGFMFSWPWQ